MRAIEVNPERRYAVAQAGLTWAHFDRVTQAFGLACTGPIVSMTGIAGFTLGGGFGCWGNGFFNDWRGHYLDELSADAIRILMAYVERLESAWTDIKIAHLERAVSRLPEGATAYGSRNARFGLVIQARWEHGSDSTAQVAWAKGLRDALAPYATGRVYANFIALRFHDNVTAFDQVLKRQDDSASRYRRLFLRLKRRHNFISRAWEAAERTKKL